MVTHYLVIPLYIKSLMRFLPTNIPVKHYAYNANPINVLKLMRSFRVVISMRLHASIFSYLAETPFISLNYHSKCSGWCAQIGAPKASQISMKHLSSHDLSQKIIDGLFYGFQKPSLSINDAVTQSLTNWSIPNEELSHTNIRSYSAI